MHITENRIRLVSAGMFDVGISLLPSVNPKKCSKLIQFFYQFNLFSFTQLFGTIITYLVILFQSRNDFLQAE